MNNLTILILAGNEEDIIEKCIKSCLMLTDTILLIDSGSNDSTVIIAKKNGVQVIKHQFVNFSDQRNFAALQATTQWILYVDSDEEITNDFISEIQPLIHGENEKNLFGGYYVRRNNYFLGKKWGMIDKMPKLFVRKKLKGWSGIVHETPDVEGGIGEISSPINHYTHRSISKMVEKTNSWSEFEAELRIKADHPKMSEWRFVRVMITGFLKSYIKEKGYKNGTAGIVESLFQAFSMFITYSKVWEKQITNEKKK